MKLLLDNANQIATGVWLTTALPHQVSRIGQPKVAQGNRSVLLASSPAFDLDHRNLILDADKVVVLNLGTTPDTLVIDTIAARAALPGEPRPSEVQHELGPGDREFLGMVERELHGEVQEAAVDLLRAVRRRSAGDLKRGESNNFSETPDNFWYVIVQPRVQALSITVRGKPEIFRPSNLELRVDRPGYTRFKLQDPDDLQEALRIIFWHANRRTKELKIHP